MASIFLCSKHKVFRPLKGVCTDHDVGEYTYEFCFFSLKASSSSFLGDYKSIEIIQPSTSAVEQEGFTYPDSDLDVAREEKLSGWVLHYDGGRSAGVG